MHPRVADRIAKNLMYVKAKEGTKAAAIWWQARFRFMDTDDYKQVQEAVEVRKKGGVTR